MLTTTSFLVPTAPFTSGFTLATDPLGPLAPDEFKLVPAKDSDKEWKIVRRKNYYQCTCPAFVYQYDTFWEHRTCKHIIALRGQDAEDERIRDAKIEKYGPTGLKPHLLTPLPAGMEASLGPLKMEESRQVEGKDTCAGNVYTVMRRKDYYQCSCPAFKFQKGIHWECRTCKHIKQVRGEKAEMIRTSAAKLRKEGTAQGSTKVASAMKVSSAMKASAKKTKSAVLKPKAVIHITKASAVKSAKSAAKGVKVKIEPEDESVASKGKSAKKEQSVKKEPKISVKKEPKLSGTKNSIITTPKSSVKKEPKMSAKKEAKSSGKKSVKKEPKKSVKKEPKKSVKKEAKKSVKKEAKKSVKKEAKKSVKKEPKKSVKKEAKKEAKKSVKKEPKKAVKKEMKKKSAKK